MRISVLPPPGRDRTGDKLALVGLAGCTFAVAMGVIAVGAHGLQVATALVGAFVIGSSVALYLRSPILAVICLWVFEMFNAPLSASVGYSTSRGEAVRQGNEILVILFVLLTVWQLLRSDSRIPPMRYLAVTVGVASFGMLSAILHHVPLTVAGLGAWLGLKFWILIWISLALPWKQSDANRTYPVFMRVGVLVALLGLVDYITHGVISRTLHTAVSYGVLGGYRANAVQSVLATPGEYSLVMSLLFALSLSRLTASRSRSDLAFALLFAASAILSLRLKGVLSLGAVLLIIVLVQSSHNPRIATAVLLTGAVLGVVTYNLEKSVIERQVSTYSSLESTPRAKLYSAGERIAANNFPFGIGFGRFASYPSRLYYSPVYQEYGLNHVWGLSRIYPKFIDDTSWPSVIGETGYGGFLIYMLGIIALIAALVQRIRVVADPAMRWIPLSALCALAVLLVDSLGDPTLFDWVATTTFAMVLGPALSVSSVSQAQVSPKQAAQR
jgi:hypothetical protein